MKGQKQRVLKITATIELWQEIDLCSKLYGSTKAEYIREAMRRMNKIVKEERLK